MFSQFVYKPNYRIPGGACFSSLLLRHILFTLLHTKQVELFCSFLVKSISSSALKTDHLTDCLTCCLVNEASLISQTCLDCATTAILHMDNTFIYKPLYKKRRGAMFGKAKKGNRNRQKHTETQYHRKIVYSKE